MRYLVVRTATMEVSADVEADSPEEAAREFDAMHAEASPIVRQVAEHPRLRIEVVAIDESVWDPDGEADADPLWEMDF